MRTAYQALLMVASLTCCALILACPNPQLTPTDAATQADVAGYTAEEHECTALAATRPEDDGCLAAVKARWCGPGGVLALRGACGDAGLTNPIVLGMAMDGGNNR